MKIRDAREEYLKLKPAQMQAKIMQMIESVAEAIGPLPITFCEEMITQTVRNEAMPRQSEVEMAAIFYRQGWRAAREQIGEY